MTVTTTNLLLPLNVLGDLIFKNSYKAAMALLDTAVGKVLTGSKTFDTPSVIDAAGTSTTVTVTGAALGDFVTGVSLSVDLAGITTTAYVSAADTVTVRFQNESGGTLDLASATLRVLVRKK